MSGMEGMVCQAWDVYTKQQQGSSFSLNGTLEDLWHKIAQMESPTAEEEEARLEICSDLTERLQSLGAKLGGNLAAEAHGSFLMGCFTSSSTLEVAVTGKLPGSTESNALVDVELRSSAERLSLLERVHSLIADCGIAAQGTVSINRTARVPSVSFEHASSGIPVRVCIAYPNFALRPHVVRGLVLLEPRLRSLLQLVELWADAHGLNNPAVGTFNSWALVNLVIFAAQTFQARPMLPPLWRVCGAPDPAAGTGIGPGSVLGTSSSGGGVAVTAGPSSSGGGFMGASSLGGSSSTGGALPVAVRPTQRLPGLTSSSEGLSAVLRDIQARLMGPPEALGLSASGSPGEQGGGLLPLFHWFLVLLDRLLAHWQLSWNRRWRVSTWWGQLVQQPFNRAFLVPVECPFDPADNAAKSLGCENQSKHQQVLRGVVDEVAASLKLLQDTRAPEDLDRLILKMFGLEVEHLYLEEEEEEVVEAEEGTVEVELVEEALEAVVQEAMAQLAESISGDLTGDLHQHHYHRHQQAGKGSAFDHTNIHPLPLDGNAASHLTAPSQSGLSMEEPAAAGAGSSIVSQARLMGGEEARPQGAADSAAAGPLPTGGGTCSRDKMKGKSKAGAVQGAWVLSAVDVADAEQSTASMDGERSAGVVAFDMVGVRAEGGAGDTDERIAAGSDRGSGMQHRQTTSAVTESPRLPTSSAAVVTVASPAVLRANARVQRPLSPLLRDVTNARQYGGQRSSQSGHEPKAGLLPGDPSVASTSAATPTTESSGGESLLPFEGLFGTLLEGARRLFDNMAQGMVELGEDLNELAATTAATIRAVINDDEDLPFLGSSSAALRRRQRRQRLQLLHRGAPGAGAQPSGAATASPASASDASCASTQSKRSQYVSSAAPRDLAGRLAQPRASPLRSGEEGPGVARIGTATPGLRAAAGSAASSPGPRSSNDTNAAASPVLASPASRTRARSAAKQRAESLMAALAAAAAAAPAVSSPSSSPCQQEPGPEALINSVGGASPCGTTAVREPEPQDSQSVSMMARPQASTMAVGTATGAGPSPVAIWGSASRAVMNDNIAAAANGLPVMLQATPVSPSAHPLAWSPFTTNSAEADKHIVATAAAGVLNPSAAAKARDVGPDGFADEPTQMGALPNVSVATCILEAELPVAAVEPVPPPLPTGITADQAEKAPLSEAVSAAAGAAVMPMAIGLLRLDSLSGTGAVDGGASTCGTSLTFASTPTAEASLSTVSSPTAVSCRSLAPTSPRKPAPVQAQPLTRAVAADLASAVGVGPVRAGTTSHVPPPPPPLPPPPRPPVGMGGLRVKSATFRKGVTRDAITSPTATGGITSRSSGGMISTTTSIAVAAASAASPSTPSSVPVPNTSITSSAGLDSLSQDTASRTLIQLSSGRLQELAEWIDRAGPGTTIDLQGNTFTGPLAAPAMKVTAPGLQLINGELALSSEQQLVVVAKAAYLTDVTIRDVVLAAVSMATPAATPGITPAAGGTIRPALLVTKQSYVGGGELKLTRCRLLLGSKRGMGLQVKGKGCSAILENCLVRGSVLAAAQASDAVLSLSRCNLEDGVGHGVCCRDHATVTATDCELRRFGVACTAVMTGGSVELVGCTLSGVGCAPEVAALEKTKTDDSDASGTANGVQIEEEAAGEEGEESTTAVEGTLGVSVHHRASKAPLCGPGVLAEGKGSSLVARGSSLEGFQAHAALVVTTGASVTLEDCRVTDSQQGAVVGTRGGRLLAARCELSSHSVHGVSIGEGATADLRDSRVKGNGVAGLHVGGVGSMAVLRGCELSANAGSGVVVAAGGCAKLDSCTVDVNGGNAAAVGSGSNDCCKHAETGGRHDGLDGCYGQGLCVAGGGARVTALRCTFSGNAGVGVLVGAHGSVKLVSCSIHGNNNSNSNSSCDCVHPCGQGSSSGDTSSMQLGAKAEIARARTEGQADSLVWGAPGMASEQSVGGVGVQVEVGACGHLSLSKGCSWGSASSAGVEGSGGPDRDLLVAELGRLERSEDG